jgi:hypothetical protein
VHERVLPVLPNHHDKRRPTRLPKRSKECVIQVLLIRPSLS